LTSQIDIKKDTLESFSHDRIACSQGLVHPMACSKTKCPHAQLHDENFNRQLLSAAAPANASTMHLNKIPIQRGCKALSNSFVFCLITHDFTHFLFYEKHASCCLLPVNAVRGSNTSTPLNVTQAPCIPRIKNMPEKQGLVVMWYNVRCTGIRGRLTELRILQVGVSLVHRILICHATSSKYVY
jgi:hypothetical protein